METQGFFSRQDIGGLDDMVLKDALQKASENMKKSAEEKKKNTMLVKAKFTCDSVIPNPYSASKVAHFHAVYGTDGEDATFSKYTPSGMLSMTIDNETPASNFFEQGKSYYLTFEEAN